MNTELTPKQQTSEAVRQAETILILTGQHPTVDQVTAVLALAMILRKLGKKVTAIVSDQLPSNVAFLPTNELDDSLAGQRDFILNLDLAKAEVDKLKYNVENGKLKINITPFKGSFAPSDVTFDYGAYHYDLAIILGVPTRARIDRVYSQNTELFRELPILNLDFHRSNENYGAVNHIDSNAASLNEMLVALSESLQTGMIDEPIATVMLAGIMASTDRFTATHTTAKSLTVAAQMIAAGARQQVVVNGLFKASRSGSDAPKRSDERPRNDTPREQPKAELAKEPEAAKPEQPEKKPQTEEPTEPVSGQSVASNQTYEPENEEVPIEDLLPPEHIVAETEGIDISDMSTVVDIPSHLKSGYAFEDLPKLEDQGEVPKTDTPNQAQNEVSQARNPLETN